MRDEVTEHTRGPKSKLRN